MGEAEDKERRDFYVNSPLRAAIGLAEALPINDGSYRGIAGHAYHDARAYFLYGCMDEVLKVSTTGLRWLQFLTPSQNPTPEPPGVPAERREHMRRIVPEAVIDEQQMWARKLNELLSDLILFETTNGQDYYRLYLAAKLLDAYLGLQQDFEEFFACRNGNADVSIKDLRKQVYDLYRSVGEETVWFLTGPVEKIKKAGRLLVSQRRRFMKALELASADQKITLGISYEMGYSTPSRSIHANIGGPERETRSEEVDKNLGRVSLLASHVVVCAHRLAGIEPVGTAKALADSLSTDDAAKMLQRVHGAQHAIGDLVFAYGRDVCLVVGKSESKYGYTSYRVKYITRPMLEEVSEDSFPARYIHTLLPRALLRDTIKRLFAERGATPEEVGALDKVPDDEITERITETIGEWEREGTLDQLLGQWQTGVDGARPPQPQK
jgi:hypothetical protein